MTPERNAEAARSTTLFHTALVAMGAQTVTDSLSLWEDVPPVPNVSTSRLAQRWLSTAVAYVMRRRIRARDMAWAYYRYQRALQTGKTVAIPGVESPPTMTLAELRREFAQALNPPQVGQEPPVRERGEENTTPPTQSPQDEIERLLGELDEINAADEVVDVEEIPGIQDALDSIEDAVEDEVQENLRVLGPETQDRKTRGAVYVEPEQVDLGREDAHNQAGNRQAAAAARNVMNGARGPLFAIGSEDVALSGFVRVSKTGTPCGWCAMLISRGPVLKGAERLSSTYRSAQGTGVQEDGSIVTFGDLDLYHDNCQCYAVPIFDTAHFANADIFDLNRRYAELWPQVTKGLSGKRAVAAWRRFIREEAKSHKAQEAAA